MLARTHRCLSIAILALFLQTGCHTGNTSSTNTAVTDTLVVHDSPVTGSITTPADTTTVAPKEEPVWNGPKIIIDTKSLKSYRNNNYMLLPGGTKSSSKTTKVGIATVKMVQTGQDDNNPEGAFDLYELSLLYDKQQIFSVSHIYGADLPFCSSDSSWFSVCVCIVASEHASRRALHLVDLRNKQAYLIDSNLYTNTNGPVLHVGDKDLLFYSSGSMLMCYDIASRQGKELVAFQFSTELSEADAEVFELSNLSYKDGVLSGVLGMSTGDIYDDTYKEHSMPFTLAITL